jgi:hypothetical protein
MTLRKEGRKRMDGRKGRKESRKGEEMKGGKEGKK